jgi:osmotically inducible protein OsmC
MSQTQASALAILAAMKTLLRRATAVWNGTGLEGSGKLSTFSGALQERPYSTHARFGDAEGVAGTNPEELIAAAHAGCFAMALSFALTGAGHPPTSLEVKATLQAQSPDIHWTITQVRLELRGRVPGIDPAKFRELAEAAKQTCPVSKLLNAEIVLDAQLV